jgi:hypothetical protein
MKLKPLLFFLIPLLLLAAWICVERTFSPQKPQFVKVFSVSSSFFSPLSMVSGSQTLGDLLRDKVLYGDFKLDDYEKLDFSLPGDPGFGSKPEFEIYNPDGNFRITYHQESIDEVTTKPNTREIYNIRRTVESDGTVKDLFYKFIPDVTLKACTEDASRVIDSRTEQHPAPFSPLPNAFVFAPDNHEVVIDPLPVPSEGACLKASDGKLYSHSVFGMRFKKPGMSKWESGEETDPRLLRAEKGDPVVELQLASIYQHKFYNNVCCGKVDYAEAYFWTKVAQGYGDAVVGTSGDAAPPQNHLSEEQKAAVDERVKEWNPTDIQSIKDQATQGQSWAQYRLGVLAYMHGDYEEAYFEFSLAVLNARGSNIPSRSQMAAARLTPAQIAAVDMRVKEWKSAGKH